MNFLFPAPKVISLEIKDDSRRFPVNRIYCLGINYPKHALEMKSDPKKEEPFFFTKPSDAIVFNGSFIDFPISTKDLHHEVELVIALKKGGKNF